MKRLFLLALVLVVLFSFCSCTIMYDIAHEDTAPFHSFYYSDSLRDAMVGPYIWDGTEEGKTIVIPETFNGYPVTKLGYYIRGPIHPFRIDPWNGATDVLCPNASDWGVYRAPFYAEDHDWIEPSHVQYITFNIHLSKNVEEFNCISLDDIYEATYEVDGEAKSIAFVFKCYFTCDENNKTFYAKDGKVYFRKNDVLVEDKILYDDFDLIQLFQDTKDSTT